MVWLFGIFLGLAVAFHLWILWGYFQMTRSLRASHPTGRLVDVIKYLVLCSEGYRNSSPHLQRIILDQKDGELKEAMGLISKGHHVGTGPVSDYFRKWETETSEIDRMELGLRRHAQFLPFAALMVAVASLYWLFLNVGDVNFHDHLAAASSWTFFAITYGLFVNWLASARFRTGLDALRTYRGFKRNLVEEALVHIPKDANPIFLTEKLNALVPQEERLEWQRVFKPTGERKAG